MLVTAIYTTDPWHSRHSMELIGIATTEKQRDRLIRQYLNQNLFEKPTREEISRAIKEVQENGQTQSLYTGFIAWIILASSLMTTNWFSKLTDRIIKK